MNFSKKVIKKIVQMRKVDKQFIAFLEKCSLIDSFEASIRLSKVYGSLKAFIKKIEGNEFISNYE